MFYAHGHNKGKWRRTDEGDAEPQRALKTHWNIRDYSGLWYKQVSLSKCEKNYPKIICNSGTHFPNIAIPVLVEFTEYLSGCEIKNLTRGSKEPLVDPVYVTTLRSVFLGKLHNFFLNDNKMVPVSSIVTAIALVLILKARCTYIALSLYFKIFWFSFSGKFLFLEILMSVNRFIFFTRDQTN
jgi:hypothetical protein